MNGNALELFSYAFRPLFLLVALQALLGIGYWSGAWFGWWPLPGQGINPAWWHAHEMVFGFAGAAIAGFVLTAVANWTGRPPVSGLPLAALAILWLLARIAALHPATAIPFAAADLGFGVLLLLLLGRELLSVGNRRNYKVLAVIGLWVACNAWYFWALFQAPAVTRLASIAGLWLVVVLINIIGGRIIPAFTGNWLRRRAAGGDAGPMPKPFGRPDLIALVLTVVYALWWLVGVLPAAAGVVGLAAGIAQLLRMSRWQGLRTGSDPLVWVLPVGFLWLPVGLILLALADWQLVPVSAGLHALGAGLVATLIVAVSSRAALGHTNRPLAAGPMMTTCYVLLTAAALLRILAALHGQLPLLLGLSALAWVGAFALYALVYVPILTRPAAR